MALQSVRRCGPDNRPRGHPAFAFSKDLEFRRSLGNLIGMHSVRAHPFTSVASIADFWRC